MTETDPEAKRLEPVCDSGTAKGSSKRQQVVTLVLCALLSVVTATLYTLSRGEYRTAYNKARQSRHTDVHGHAWHRVNRTVDHTHPIAGYFAARNHTFGTSLLVLLVGAGLSFETALLVVIVVFRTVFGVGISWLMGAVTRSRRTALLAVLLAYCFPRVAIIYGLTPTQALAGMLTTSVFLVAVALCLLGFRRVSIAAWLFQLWVHPVTFACWAPLYWGTFLATSSFAARLWPRLGRRFCVLLVIVPPLCGIAAGLAEAAGYLPFKTDETYWALVRTRASHSVFLFSDRYGFPLNYFSLVAALLMLASSGNSRRSPLRSLNILAAFLGLGIGLMYLTSVETHFSAVANACLPLRFESVMFPILLANIFYIVSCSEKASQGSVCFAAGYGIILAPVQLNPILGAWAWALGHRWLETDKRRLSPFLGAVAVGVAVIVLYLLLAPARLGVAWKVRNAAWFLRALPAVALVFVLSLWMRRLKLLSTSRLAILFPVTMIGAALVNGHNFEFQRHGMLAEEVSAIVRGRSEVSPEKEAFDWLNANLPPGASVLSHAGILLHLTTHVRPSINNDTAAFFVYAPQLAGPTAEEIHRIYGLDVRELARKRKRLSPLLGSEACWVPAREKVLRMAWQDSRAYEWVVEPSSMPTSGAAPVVFENAFVRIYAVPLAREHPSFSSQKGPVGGN
jgi:hypothetical protein